MTETLDLAPDAIMQLGLGFWGSKALLSAVELGLFTELAKEPLDGKRLRQRLGLHERAQDFLEEPLPAADVIVMGHLLHDWDLETKRQLLAKAHTALPVGGALVVYDQMIDDDRRANAAGLLMSLNMLIATPSGFDYTGAECLRWLREAGFVEVCLDRLGGPYSMAVGIK